MVRLVFILGAQNSADGALSAIALGRVARAIEEQRSDPTVVLLATGGFGSNFNLSRTPHRELVYRQLEQQGAKVERAEPGDLLSSNTVEDILMASQHAARRGFTRYDIVTSEFHAPRCRFIVNCIARDYAVTVLNAPEPVDISLEMQTHEAKALARLESQGGVLVDGVLYPFALA